MIIQTRIESPDGRVVGFTVMSSGRSVEAYLPDASHLSPAEGAKATVDAIVPPEVTWDKSAQKVVRGTVSALKVDGVVVDLTKDVQV